MMIGHVDLQAGIRDADTKCS